MLISNSACPTITLPTRVTDNSKTIIDNIITNDNNYILSGIIQTDIGEHYVYVVFSFILNYSKPLHKNTLVYRRDKSHFNTENFCHQLQSNLENLHTKFINASPNIIIYYYYLFLFALICTNIHTHKQIIMHFQNIT